MHGARWRKGEKVRLPIITSSSHFLAKFLFLFFNVRVCVFSVITFRPFLLLLSLLYKQQTPLLRPSRVRACPPCPKLRVLGFDVFFSI